MCGGGGRGGRLQLSSEEEKVCGGEGRHYVPSQKAGWKTGRTSSRPCGVLLLLTQRTKVTRTVDRLVRPVGPGAQKWT